MDNNTVVILNNPPLVILILGVLSIINKDGDK